MLSSGETDFGTRALSEARCQVEMHHSMLQVRRTHHDSRSFCTAGLKLTVESQKPPTYRIKSNTFWRFFQFKDSSNSITKSDLWDCEAAKEVASWQQVVVAHSHSAKLRSGALSALFYCWLWNLETFIMHVWMWPLRDERERLRCYSGSIKTKLLKCCSAKPHS